MATWIDFFSLTATIAVVGGVIYVIIYVLHGIQASWATAKESLKTKGLNVSKTGISVKTSKRFDHDDYMEATRRGIVNVVSASSFGKAEDDSSSTTSQEKTKKGIFRSRK